jgi:hypothetical protein
MSIVRTVHERDFTVIANGCLRDDSLSAESLGVLCYLLGKPNDWTVRPTELAKRFGSGRDRIDRILKELIAAGYIVKAKTRDPLTGLWRAVEYIVFQMPKCPPPENTEVVTGPPTGNPSTDNPPPDNREVLNTDFLTNTESTKELVPAKAGREKLTTAQIEQIFEEEFWPVYPKRAGTRGKPEAKTKFVSKVKSGEKPEAIIAAAVRLAEEWAPRVQRNSSEAKYIPMAATWLNKNRHRDEQGTMPEAGGESSGISAFFDLSVELQKKTRQPDDFDGNDHLQLPAPRADEDDGGEADL